MKKIVKEQPPTWFETWKQNFKQTHGRTAHYKNDFSSDDSQGTARRQQLRGHLIKEQGHICCYCMKRISLQNSHIEHFQPKIRFPQNDLDYQNLLASCNGDGMVSLDGHCGHKKEDWWEDNLVSPTESKIEEMFQYSLDGNIHSIQKKPFTNIAQEMIGHMGLDSYHLIRNRRAAIESSEVFDENEYSNEDIRNFIDFYSNKDGEAYVPYCMAIVACLKEQLG